MTGIGVVPVQVPRVRDRGSNEDGGKIKFRSSLVSPYLRNPGWHFYWVYHHNFGSFYLENLSDFAF